MFEALIEINEIIQSGSAVKSLQRPQHLEHKIPPPPHSNGKLYINCNLVQINIYDGR